MFQYLLSHNVNSFLQIQHVNDRIWNCIFLQHSLHFVRVGEELVHLGNEAYSIRLYAFWEGSHNENQRIPIPEERENRNEFVIDDN